MNKIIFVTMDNHPTEVVNLYLELFKSLPQSISIFIFHEEVRSLPIASRLLENQRLTQLLDQVLILLILQSCT